ncbi:MAG TPA: YIP1 family protein [Candidatus Binatus sp.]|nr:YIP1 family protein [Candidatus Binatus sp.]
MANGAGGSITPFFTIWTEPRATIRRVVETDPKRYVIALAAIGPAVSALANQWSKAIDNNANLSVLWPLEVALAVAFGAVIGIVSLYISGAILRWSGGLIGGVASQVEMRAALAWAQVPAIAAEVILLMAVLQGIAIPHLSAAAALQIDPAFYKVGVVEAILTVWGSIVGIYCIAEVHRFSAWRAFCATLIPAGIAMVVLGFVVWVVYALIHH